MNLNCWRKKNNGGLNLLETIVAAMIFISVVVVVTSVWVWYGRTVAASRSILVGSQLGESVIEQCVSAGFDGVDALNNSGRDFTMKTTIDGKELTTTYHCKVKVSTPAPPSSNLKNVVAEVSWENKTGPEVIKFETELFRQE